MGERSPVNDSQVRGMFYGMSPSTGPVDMQLAVLEGVAFALRQNLDMIRSLGVRIESSGLCGGGAQSETWAKILASVLGLRLDIPAQQQGAALGAAFLAAQGTMDNAACRALATANTAVQKSVEPDAALSAMYDEQYEKWLKLYPAAKNI